MGGRVCKSDQLSILPAYNFILPFKMFEGSKCNRTGDNMEFNEMYLSFLIATWYTIAHKLLNFGPIIPKSAQLEI